VKSFDLLADFWNGDQHAANVHIGAVKDIAFNA
jgi:hypothetical protein